MEKKLQPLVTVSCPHCGYKHLVSEVFYPDDVIGRPKTVVRDPLGNPLYVDWHEDCEPLTEETFYCDHCGKPFIAEIELKVTTRPQEEELDFSETQTSLL